MPFERINLRLSNCDWNAAVCKTVEVLRSGHVAVVPTETVYGLAVRLTDSQAVNKLIQLKGRNENHPFALAFPNAEAIDDYCSMSPLAHRLARRCLPGPVSLVLDIPSESPFWELPKDVQYAVTLQSSLCCRVPDHPLLTTVLNELNEPIILTSANKSGQGENDDVEKIVAELGDGIALLLDEGSLSVPKPSTIVKISGTDFSVLREGVLKLETIRRLSAIMILFVCSGNQYRSPMAEYLCEKLLAERLQCSIEELDQRGIVVLSAGVSAPSGEPASNLAIAALQEWGIDMNSHRSQRLNEMHIKFADYIFAMTRHHREQILSLRRDADSRLNVLRKDGGDITDPPGNSESAHRACAEQIRREIEYRLHEIPEII